MSLCILESVELSWSGAFGSGCAYAGFTLITQTWVSWFQHRVLHANIALPNFIFICRAHTFIHVCVSDCVYVCVSVHSFAYVLIHLHHLYVVKSAKFNVLRFSGLHLLMLPLSFTLSLSLYSFLCLFLPGTCQIGLWFCAPYLCMYVCVCVSGFHWIFFLCVMVKHFSSFSAVRFLFFLFCLLPFHWKCFVWIGKSC